MKVEQLLEQGFEIFSHAYKIAAEAHKDQKRSDGKPYMSHIDKVIENVWTYLEKEYEHCIGGVPTIETSVTEGLKVQYLLAIAALHDTVEDQAENGYTLNYIVASLSSLFDDLKRTEKYKNVNLQVHNIWESVELLTKIEGESYDHYVRSIRQNEYSRIVKIADLKHNMSNLEKGNLLAKYELTSAVLEHRI